MSDRTPTIPEGLDLIQTQSGVIIRKSWFSWLVVPMVFFVIFWDGFLVFWYFMAFHSPKHGPQAMMLLFPLLHVGVGIGLTYFVVSSFFNKTDVTVSFSGVQVSIYPLPWPGNKQVAAGEITDILVRERSAGNNNYNYNNRRISYAVMYAVESRKERKLVSFSQSDQAEYVANAIRMALQLKQA